MPKMTLNSCPSSTSPFETKSHYMFRLALNSLSDFTIAFSVAGCMPLYLLKFLVSLFLKRVSLYNHGCLELCRQTCLQICCDLPNLPPNCLALKCGLLWVANNVLNLWIKFLSSCIIYHVNIFTPIFSNFRLKLYQRNKGQRKLSLPSGKTMAIHPVFDREKHCYSTASILFR